jgi:short-subunit dehydrogenase
VTRLADYRFAGRTAVLTGAASGIGEQLALALAARGSDLVLLDRDADRLDAVTAAIEAAGPGRGVERVSVERIVVDLADRRATVEVAERIAADRPRIGLLINNAGVALAGRFTQLSMDDFDWVMDVNFRAPVLLTHHLLGPLTAERGSHLVNVSSAYGLISPPGQSAYSASKFALRGFSQVLRAELAGQGVGVTTVHPGGVRTRIAENARLAAGTPRAQGLRDRTAFDRLLNYPPERASDEILRAVERRRARVLIGPDGRLCDVASRLMPVSNLRLLTLLSRPRR